MLYRAILHQKQFKYLGAFYLHSITRLFAISIFQVFNGIYTFTTFTKSGFSYHQSLSLTTLFFSLLFVVQALSIAPSLWLISKKGLRFSVLFGNLFLICFLVFLYLSQFDLIFFILAAVFGGLQIGLYWTAHHIYFAELTDDKGQGEEISLSTSLSAVVSGGGPAFGGLVISYFGYGAIFFIMSVIVLIGILPLRFLPKSKDTISINILETVKALAPKKELKSYISLFGESASDITFAVFWPIFIISILQGVIGVGFVGSLVALFGSVTTLVLGFLIDRYGPKKVINIASSMDSIFWVVRIFVLTPVHVFIVSGLSALARSGQIISLDSSIYERARHTNLAAFVTQREVGLAVGRGLYLLVMGLLLWFGMPLQAMFLTCALLALLTRMYPYVGKQDLKEL